MRKKWQNKKQATRNLIIGAIVGTGIFSFSLIKIESDLSKTLNNDFSTLNQELEALGYDIFDNNLEESGYLIGYNHAYYQTFYDLNTTKMITNEELYDRLENIYNGNDKELYQKGLLKGINDGVLKAYNKVKK